MAALPAWLNPAQPLDSELRLKTPDGIDLRQACYVPVTKVGVNEHAILARTRNYQERRTGEPDQQTITRYQSAIDSQTTIEITKGYPVSILVDPGHSKWAVVALTPTEDQAVHDANFSVFSPDRDHGLTGRLIPEWQYPRQLQGDVLGCNKTTAIQLDGGLVNVSWQAEQVMQTLALVETDQPVASLPFALQSTAGALVDCTVNFDPMHPEAATVRYDLSLASGDRQFSQWAFEYPYHVTYGAAAWDPPLCWADGTQLATVLFQPGATGHSRRANHLGLFRLVTMDAATGAITLIDDHLEAHLPVVAAGGVLFYVRQAPGEDGPSWEVWAASTDGLSKRLVLVESDALYLTVEDALPDRLLVQRQYLEVTGDTPHLYSELHEYSLQPLKPGQIELESVSSPVMLDPEATDGANSTKPNEAINLPPAPPAGTLKLP